jgi:hypothetical protein
MTSAQDFGCLSGADRAPHNSNLPGQTEIVMCTELLATMHRSLSCCFSRMPARKSCSVGSQPDGRTNWWNSRSYGRYFPPGTVLSRFVLIASTFKASAFGASGFLFSRGTSSK